jgi:nitrite reductase (NO-forming)
MPPFDKTAEPQDYTPQAVPPGRRLLAGVRGNSRAMDWFRVAFGVVWLIDAVLKWEPAFRAEYTGMIRTAATGQPGWLHGWFHFWINLVAPNAGFFTYSTAVIESLIGLALIFGFASKLTYVSSALFSLLIWATAEGFGGPYIAGSTDIGTSVIYALVFMGLLVLNYELGPSRFSVDYLIEQRVSWWHRIADVGHKHHADKPASPTTPPPIAPVPAAAARPVTAAPTAMAASPPVAVDAPLIPTAGR